MAISEAKAMKLAKEYLVKERGASTYITALERAALTKMGYNPWLCRLIGREDGSSVFICYEKIVGPIIITGA